MIFQNSFVFDEKTFRDYYELHLRPHDKGNGRASVAMGIAHSLVGGLWFSSLLITLLDGAPLFVAGGVNTEALRDLPMIFIVGLYFATGLSLLIFGVRLLVRPRRPKWDTVEWMSKTDASFKLMKEGDTEIPISYGLESKFGVAYL